MAHIRCSKPTIVGRELEYLRQALAQHHLGSHGAFARRCQTHLVSQLRGALQVSLTHTATTAFELATVLAELAPGDEVVMPAFTFVTCATAVALRGATPVFVDISADTLNLDPAAVARAITERTRAIFVVHYAGVPCDMASISTLADRHSLIVIEDAAQAFMSSYRGRSAGTLGHLGALSFHDTKNVMCGEGGAIIINDARFLERAEVVYRCGTNRVAFERGQRSNYNWIDLGSSYGPSEITAAVLLAQLESADAITRSRQILWSRYHSAFADLEKAGLARRPVVPEDVDHNAHIYYLLLPDAERRDRFIAAMAARDISTPFHFVPLDDTPGGRRYARAIDELPVTHSAASRLVRLPLWFGMQDEQDRVIEAVLDIVGSFQG